ncbi:zinc ribbon domain-containing protein [Janibacter sp. G56]|uniref:zinc ribbon domain-containing protein n=1 Tax=Janibacter sp. G56 TaxID=3418717 RepID=UPI003D00155D
MKADPTQQLRLLDLQAIDTRLDQIRHAATRLPEIARLSELEDRTVAVRADLVRAETALADIQSEVARAESDVQLVRERMARDQQRLDSGSGSSKDLQALQHEVASLTRRQGELEDVEIEVMERAETAEADVARLRAERDELAGSEGELVAARDAALAELDKERDELTVPRETLVFQVGKDLLALYEKVRAHSGGLAASALRARRCGGCQLELNPMELKRLAAAPADEVLRCEECDRILVRTAESGLPA